MSLPAARTPEGKVVLFERSTGRRITRWPVDARDILAQGDYTADPNECEQPAQIPPPEPELPKGVLQLDANFVHPLNALAAAEGKPGMPVKIAKGGSEAAPFAGPVRSTNTKR